MRKSTRIPISTMINLLKEISSGGGLYKVKSIKYSTSKIAFLFNSKITSFNTHFILTKNLLMRKDKCLSVAYELLFQRYLKSIFTIFFKVKIRKALDKKEFLCICKKLPNYLLYVVVKKIMDDFFEEEKNKFKVDEIRKNFFLLNTFLENDDESESNDSTCQNDDEEISL